MAVGLKLPVGVDGSGGSALVSGDAQDSKILTMALGDDENDNAFQQNIGLGAFMIFEQPGDRTNALVRQRIKAIFRDFRAAQRFRLVPDSVVFKEEAEQGEFSVEFKYINLESDEERTFSARIVGGRFLGATVATVS